MSTHTLDARSGLDAHALELLRRADSLHGLGRIAADPAHWIPHRIQSYAGGCGGGMSYQTTRKGTDIWTDGDRFGPPDIRITWSAVRAHVERYVDEGFRDRFRALDYRWCRGRTADLQRQIDALSLTIWSAETTLDTEGRQLDLFA